MTAVVFETPGLIDVRAFTIMGAHAKPLSPNPIGYFGTGLKYAIAVLVRMGCEPTVWIGRDKLTFSKKASKFRGTDLETIKMTVLKDGNKRATSYELPFTTRYGANWKTWMAFRELESNTRDEGGTTSILEDGWDRDAAIFSALLGNDKTLIVVDNPEFVEAARKIDDVFLPRARREGTLLEAIDPNDWPDADREGLIYYRTMRAMDAGKPTLFTYNILEKLQLTEDRTLAYTFQVRDVLARWVLTEATEAQVEAVVTAEDEWWEHGLEFPGHVAPSEAFRAVMTRRPKGISRYAHGYYSLHSGAAPIRVAYSFSLADEAPFPWKVQGDCVFDKTGTAVFERPSDMGARTWDGVADTIIRRIGAGELIPEAESVDEEPEAEPAEPLEAEDTEATEAIQ